MEHDTLAEMELVQIPKEFRPNKHERKSPWAVIVIIIAIILCGGFFLQQKITLTVPLPIETLPREKKQDVSSTSLEDLEASVGNIVIPDYTDTL